MEGRVLPVCDLLVPRKFPVWRRHPMKCCLRRDVVAVVVFVSFVPLHRQDFSDCMPPVSDVPRATAFLRMFAALSQIDCHHR